MSVGQELYKNIGPMCCRSGVHHRHPASKMKIGFLLVAIGLIWLGARVGFIDLSWLHAVPFWPAAFILFGAWLVYNELRARNQEQLTKKGRRFEMEAMFTKMMEGCMKGMSEEDKKNMMACGEKMAAMCRAWGRRIFPMRTGRP